MPRQRDGGPAIIVGTDGSASATEAVRRAAQLARARGAALHIVNAYRRASRAEIKLAQSQFQREVGYSQMGSFEVDGIGDNHTVAISVLEDAAHAAGAEDVRTFLHAVNTEPHKALCWVAEEKQAQLVVVGNKPAAHILHPFRRPVHERLALVSICPVHVVDTSPWWHAPYGSGELRTGYATASA